MPKPPRWPGRPRVSPDAPLRKLGPVRFDPDLYQRMDEQLKKERDDGLDTTQRAFIERSIRRELEDPVPE